MNQYELDYAHGEKKQIPANPQSRPSKGHSQTLDNASYQNVKVQTQTNKSRQTNQWPSSKYENDHYSSQKFNVRSISKSTQMQPVLSKHVNVYDSRREREVSQLSIISKGDSIQSDEKQFKRRTIEKDNTSTLQRKSPLSQKNASDHQNNHQQLEIYKKTMSNQSVSSPSPPSHDELIDDNISAQSPTYLLTNDNQQRLLDGRYVIPSNAYINKKKIPLKNIIKILFLFLRSRLSSKMNPSSHVSSGHTYPFTCTPDFDNRSDNIISSFSQPIKIKKQSSKAPDIYVLSDRENTQNTIDRQKSPSSPLRLSSTKKLDSSHPQVAITNENDDIASNYDSDDGWSDDSAELLYVDERYATEKGKITLPSHLSSQQTFNYQIQEQNMLLQ